MSWRMYQLSIWFNAQQIISNSMKRYLNFLWASTCRKHSVRLWITNLQWRERCHQMCSNNFGLLFQDAYILETPLVSTRPNTTLHTLEEDSSMSMFLLFSTISTLVVRYTRRSMLRIRTTFCCQVSWESAQLSALRPPLLTLTSASCPILKSKLRMLRGSPRPSTRTMLFWQGESHFLILSSKNHLKSQNTQGNSTKWTPTCPMWEDWWEP